MRSYTQLTLSLVIVTVSGGAHADVPAAATLHERCMALDAAAQASDIEPPLETPAPQQPEERAERRPTKSYLVGHILVGAGIAAIGGGSYFYLKGRRTIDAHNDAATYEDFIAGTGALDEARRQQMIGVAALAAGGTAIIGGILFYVLHARTPPTAGVALQVTPSTTTFTLARSF